MPLIPGVLVKHLRQFNSDEIEDAKNTLVSLARTAPDAKTRMAAAQYILEMETPPRVVDIESDLQGKTVDEAADAIIAATASGKCALPDGERLLTMLRQKQEISAITTLNSALENNSGQRDRAIEEARALAAAKETGS